MTTGFVLRAAAWYRLPDGQIGRVLSFCLHEGIALSIDLWTEKGVRTVSWKDGQAPELVPLETPRVGEWWHFLSCSRHGSRNVIGELPFLISERWPFFGKASEELVSCGCLVPDQDFGAKR